MRKKLQSIITIIYDDREKKPWTSKFLGKQFKFISQRLETGDYTLPGLEKYLCIERKANWDELVANFFNKKYRKNIYSQLERMKKFKWKFIIMETSFNNIYNQRKSPYMFVNTTSLLKLIVKLFIEYGITILWLPNRTYRRDFLREFFIGLNNYKNWSSIK